MKDFHHIFQRRFHSSRDSPKKLHPPHSHQSPLAASKGSGHSTDAAEMAAENVVDELGLEAQFDKS